MEGGARQQLQVVRGRGTARMLFSGDLDLGSGPWFGSAIDGELAAAHDVIVDLSAARIADCTPIGILIRARDRAAAAGRRLEVLSPPPLFAG